MSVLPFKSEGQLPQLVNEANINSLGLRPPVLLSQNLQHTFTRTLLCCATGVNEQFPGWDINPQEPITVCDVTLTPKAESANGEPTSVDKAGLEGKVVQTRFSTGSTTRRIQRDQLRFFYEKSSHYYIPRLG